MKKFTLLLILIGVPVLFLFIRHLSIKGVYIYEDRDMYVTNAKKPTPDEINEARKILAHNGIEELDSRYYEISNFYDYSEQGSKVVCITEHFNRYNVNNTDCFFRLEVDASTYDLKKKTGCLLNYTSSLTKQPEISSREAFNIGFPVEHTLDFKSTKHVEAYLYYMVENKEFCTDNGELKLVWEIRPWWIDGLDAVPYWIVDATTGKLLERGQRGSL